MAFLNLVSKRNITRWYDEGQEKAIQDGACKPGLGAESRSLVSWGGVRDGSR